MIVNIKMCVGIYGGHGRDIFTCPSKNVHFGETETPKIILIFWRELSHWLASDSQKKFAADAAKFSLRRPCGASRFARLWLVPCSLFPVPTRPHWENMCSLFPVPLVLTGKPIPAHLSKIWRPSKKMSLTGEVWAWKMRKLWSSTESY